MAGLYDDYTRDDLLAEIMRWKEQSARNAQTCMRMRIALNLARHIGVHSRAFCGQSSLMLADWLDAGMTTGVPWPTSPFAADWLRQHGYSESSDGMVTIRATMTLATEPTEH